MQYKAISADGHVNEPPTLWVDNLPEKFTDRGPSRHRDPEDQGPRLDHGGPDSGRRPWASPRCTSAPPSASTGLRWSRASNRSKTVASATRICSPARTTRRPGSKRSSRIRPTPR